MARDVPQNYRELVIRQHTVVRNGAQRPGRDLRLVTWARNTPKSKRQSVILCIRQNTIPVQQIADGIHTLAAATNDTASAARRAALGGFRFTGFVC
jgi:hypothetical protein